jgi:hypothetical protein
MVHQQGTWKKFAFVVRGTCSLALALGVGAAVQARQQDQDQQQDQQQQQTQSPDAQQPTPAPDAQPPKPVYAPQDADKPPYAKDRPAQRSTRSAAPNEPAPPPAANIPVQNGPGQNGPAQNERTQNEPAQNEREGQYRPVPPTLTIPAGTVLLVRINEYLSSDRNQIGDRVTAVLQQPIVVNGWVVARRGQVLTGQVEAAVKAGRVKGVSQLGIELTDLAVVDGEQRPILTELWKGTGGTSHGQDAARFGTTTALGAAIGAAADWGRGAAIGAGAGAAAGIGAVLLTRGHPTVIEPETQLSFRLVNPVKVDTTQSQQAFLPVSQQDFDGGREERRPRRIAGGYPPPGPYGCGYYQPCYLYPGYVGFYDGFGWGSGFYGGGFGHRGFHH